MAGLRKDTGFIIDLRYIDGLETVIRKKKITVHYRIINKSGLSDLLKTISTLRNPSNISSGKIKFIVVKLTEWTFLNAILIEKKDIFKEFFQLLKYYPHLVYIYDGNLRREFSSVKMLNDNDLPQNIHLLDFLVNHKSYKEIINKPNIEEELFEDANEFGLPLTVYLTNDH